MSDGHDPGETGQGRTASPGPLVLGFALLALALPPHMAWLVAIALGDQNLVLAPLPGVLLAVLVLKRMGWLLALPLLVAATFTVLYYVVQFGLESSLSN